MIVPRTEIEEITKILKFFKNLSTLPDAALLGALINLN